MKQALWVGPSRRLATLVLGIALGGATACDDPFGLEASEATVTDTLRVYAIVGTAASLPVAYNAVNGQVARIDPGLAFDVAFDITADGKVRLFPARLISPLKQLQGLDVSTHQVGMQLATGSFDALTRAPERGFLRDSLVVANVGQPVVIELQPEVCQFSLSSVRYAKLVVDSIRVATRELYFRAVRNPNCGFRSFLPGVPKD